MAKKAKPSTKNYRPAAAVAELREELLKSRPSFRNKWEKSARKRAVATALVRLRKQAGRSQAQLAESAGWDKAFVSRLEAASGAVPDTATLVRYAKACDRAVGVVFASIRGNRAHIIDGVTLHAPQTALLFETLRGKEFELQGMPAEYPPEHRWGDRITVDIPVKVSIQPSTIGVGRILSISISGAWISGKFDANVSASASITVNFTLGGRPAPVSIACYVARIRCDGIGVEWREPRPQMVSDLLLLAAGKTRADESSKQPRRLPRVATDKSQ